MPATESHCVRATKQEVQLLHHGSTTATEEVANAEVLKRRAEKEAMWKKAEEEGDILLDESDEDIVT